MTLEQTILPICMGLGIAAACGFRVFLPFFVIGLAEATGYVELNSTMAWLGDGPALVMLGTATVLEIAGFYVPWVDNLLDTITTPAAVVAGTLATAGMITDMHPVLEWTIAAIGGGGTAAGVQAVTVATRAASSLATGGLGNPVFTTVETGASLAVALLALVAAIGVVVVVLAFFAWLIYRLVRRRSRRLDPTPVAAVSPV